MILEITPDQIELLSDSDLRSLIALLSEREVIAAKHSASAVTWGGHQNAADGGIDVRVALPTGAQISGYIPAPETGFQVKAENMPRQKILDEMTPEGTLRRSIEELATKGGAYIIVSSKGSHSDTALQDRKAAMAEAVAECASAANLTLDFYDRRRVATWVNQHPGLVPWIREKVGHPLSGWRPFEDWSSSPAPLEQPYLLDGRIRLIGDSVKDSGGLSAQEGLMTLRKILAQPKGVVRLVGLSGVGKTRLIQALFDERIGQEALPKFDALYTDISDSPEPVPHEMLSRLIALNHRIVMIVDNCGAELHRKLATRISSSNCLLSLITVEHDVSDDEPEGTSVFRLETASAELVEEILAIHYPAIFEPSRRVIAKFSDGNARIALALAETAKNGESLTNLRDKELFSRLFEQTQGASQELLDAAKVCALLYSFDGETLEGDESELTALATLAATSVDKLYKQVAELYRRQLVQKRSKWRALLPQALANRLAKLALEDIPFQRIEKSIIEARPQRMLRSFSRRIGYLHDAKQASELVDKWFGEGGLLEHIGKLDEPREEILENIAPVNPEATLAYFETALTRDEWFVGAQNHNISQIVGILRSIAYEPALFDRAVEFLKVFALIDLDNDSSTAIDPLESLFHLYLSGTHATPAQRVSFVRGLLESNYETETRLGVRLLGAMLECSQFTSSYSFEFGARKRDYGLHPNNESEIKEWFLEPIELARSVGLSDKPVAPDVRRMLATHLGELLLRTGLTDVLSSIAETFASKSGWPEGWIGVRSAMRKGKDAAPTVLMEKFEVLEKRLRPMGLAARIRSYALAPENGSLDIAEVDADDEEPTAAHENIQKMCVELGAQLALSPDEFDLLLPEILTAESTKTLALGRGVGASCDSVSECWRKLKTSFLAIPVENRQARMLCGYLAAATARNEAEGQAILDDIFADPRLHPYLIYWQTCAETSNRSFQRLMAALDTTTVPLVTYGQLSLGAAHEVLSDEEFREFLQKLMTKEGGVTLAADILGMRIFGRRSKKESISEALEAAGRDVLALVPLRGRASARINHHTADIIKISLGKPEHDSEARELCARILQGVKNHQVRISDIGQIVKALATVAPIAVLNILVEQASDEENARRSIFRELSGEKTSPLSEIPEGTLLNWAAAKPDTRYINLAQVIHFFKAPADEASSGWSSAATKVIELAPEPVRVLDVFLKRFSPTSWGGSRADIMESRMPLIEEFAKHPNPQVARWAQDITSKFKADIARERQFEAASSRTRDETFE